MGNRKKVILNVLIFFVIFGMTIWGVFHGENLGELRDVILSCDWKWLLPAVVCVFIFIWGESIIIWYMMRSYGYCLKKTSCFLFSSVGFFFSCVTPSASGGQPMQIYFMKKEKIPIPVSTVILMIVTITYKFVLVVIGLGIWWFAGGFMHHYLDSILPVFYLGIFLNVFCVIAMGMLVFHPYLARNILLICVRVLERLHILKHKENRLGRLEASMDVYNATAAYMKSHIGLIINVILISFGQRIALFAVPCFVYLAFHLSGKSLITILILQAVVAVSVDMLPLPGGMGISETLFLIIFEPIFGELLLPGMVLSRGLGYYSELIISAIFTVVTVLVYAYRERRKL